MLQPENGGKLGETLEIREWRRRLKSLLGDEEEGERTEGAVGREGEEVRVRREEPVYSSDHRIAWLCGDPSK